LAVALAIALVPLVSAPALADDFAPEITSFERLSLDVLGSEQLVKISFTARDEGPAGLAYAMFTYRTPLGAEIRVDSPWMGRQSEGTFVAVQPLGLWAASGEYVLQKVEVLDREWNRTVYERGSVTRFDFGGADFKVRNPLEDTVTPTLESIRLFQHDVAQGTPVVALYGARDNLSGVSEVVVMGFGPTGQNFHVRSLPQLGAAGPATWLVPLGAATGVYGVTGVHVSDRAGNTVHYDIDRTGHYPPNASVPDHEAPDITTLDFRVLGGTEDTTPPLMATFSSLTPQARRLGERVAFDFKALEQGSGVQMVSAEWSDPLGHTLYAHKTCGDRTEGPLSTTIEDYRTIGSRWTLDYISFVDYLGNQTSYRRDGTVMYQGGDSGPPTHAFDLSQADFVIERGEARPSDIPDSTALYCPPVGTVGLHIPDQDVLFGEAVTIGGLVRGAQGAIPEPLVAVHQFVGGEPLLTDVVEGNADGTYTSVFTPKASGAIGATFLGAAGPSGADVSTSPRVKVVVRPRIEAALADVSIVRGSTTKLAGSVTPALNGTVTLQRKTRGGWERLRTTALSSGGTFSFPVGPSRVGTHTFRVVRAGGKRLAAGSSPSLSLTVRDP
jgi:hypothetical protein